MQIRIARVLLFIFLTQSTQFGEVFKAPLLVAHYIQHKKLYPKTTVYSFVKMHYIDKTVVDADYAQDMQLPFKTIDNHFLSMQLSLPPLIFQLIKIPDYIITSKLPIQAFDPLSFFPAKIFQPPKLV
jgi:hypothetical protein